MKVALIGASGFVGKAILNELLSRGHQVRAVSRHPENVEQNPNLTFVKADVLQEDKLVAALAGQDAVISTYNAGWDNPNLYSEFIEGSLAIQAGVKKAGLKRLIVVGGAGSLFVSPEVQLVDSPDFPEAWKMGALAAREYLNLLKAEKELEWTFLSPAIEMTPQTSGKRSGKYRIGLENPVYDENQRSIISVEDAAVALVDELEHPKHIRQRFTVAY